MDRVVIENNALSGADAQEKNGLNTALSKTALALNPKTPEEIAVLEARRNELNKLDTEIDKYIADACSQGKASATCQSANELAQGLQSSYSEYVGKLTYRELNSGDYAKVSQIVANTSADKWDYAIDNYAKSQNISYQEAKDKFALVININQAADITGILYGLKGSGTGKGAISSSAASTLKQVLSKYDEFKQKVAVSTKGNNDTLVMAGAGNSSGASAGSGLPSNVNLSTGAGGTRPTVNPDTKIATGQSVGEFEKSLSNLSPRERVAVVKESAPKIAAENGMIKDNQLTKRNNRDVYRGKDGNFYALDTQHGRFEVVSSKGKHLGEVDFSMQKIPNSLDKSGGHDLKVK